MTEPKSPPRLLRQPEVTHRTGLPKSKIYRMMGESAFPQCIPLGARTVAWREDEVDAWIRARIASAVAEREAKRIERARHGKSGRKPRLRTQPEPTT